MPRKIKVAEFTLEDYIKRVHKKGHGDRFL